MSHSVTVTRTTTTSTTSAILLNTGYFKTYPGLLKLFELLIGAVIIGITAYYSNYAHNYPTSSPEVFLCIVAVTCLVGTGCLLLSCILSISSASILPKTIFEMVFGAVATLLLLSASASTLQRVRGRNEGFHIVEKGYSSKVFASVSRGALHSSFGVLILVQTVNRSSAIQITASQNSDFVDFNRSLCKCVA
ncbi:uncharacterized protein LOC117644282 isoform X2 [Thrips palmi]|nr:uncharacterized protein LOC117644282 isoform X2 [Thrips palmi]XP_034239497.1 uncharacterized protein LOC117644282 isoform X2 [Thrips palmi]